LSEQLIIQLFKRGNTKKLRGIDTLFNLVYLWIPHGKVNEELNMSDESGLTLRMKIDAAPEDVFYAISTPQGWRDWLCDSARFESRAGGTYQLAWNSGWYVAGVVKEIEKPEKVVLTWHGMAEPGATEVRFELKGENGVTEVIIIHTGFGEGEEWVSIRQEVEKGWDIGLENLESLFSTGADLRVVRRPMLGIMLSDFSEEIAALIGVPVTEGVRIDRPIEGMGAEKAGLQANDVIVSMGGEEIKRISELGVALQGRQAGDVISVVFYREDKRMEVEMELSGRPFPETPKDTQEFADRLAEVNAEVLAEVKAVFQGVSESEADFRLSPKDWSAKEALAHLILSEVFLQNWIAERQYDAEREFSDQGENSLEQLQGLVTVTPTIEGLLDRLESTQRETIEFLRRIEQFNSRPGTIWTLALNTLSVPGTHERSHLEQIKETLAAAKGGN
jgi:uncharacterized protein YndB with AHSA1/START domain